MFGLEKLIDKPSPTYFKLKWNYLPKSIKYYVDNLQNLSKIKKRPVSCLANQAKPSERATPTACVGECRKRRRAKSISLSSKFKKPIFEQELKQLDSEGEVAIKEFPCSMKKPTLAIQGLLFVTQNYLCFANFNITLVKLRHKVVTLASPFLSKGGKFFF